MMLFDDERVNSKKCLACGEMINNFSGNPANGGKFIDEEKPYHNFCIDVVHDWMKKEL